MRAERLTPLPGLAWTEGDRDAAGRAMDMARLGFSAVAYQAGGTPGNGLDNKAARQQAIDFLVGARLELDALVVRLTGARTDRIEPVCSCEGNNPGDPHTAASHSDCGGQACGGCDTCLSLTAAPVSTTGGDRG